VRQLCQEDERENWQKVIVSIMDDDDVYELRCTKRRAAMFSAMF
jgi:predicted secreted protein